MVAKRVAQTAITLAIRLGDSLQPNRWRDAAKRTSDAATTTAPTTLEKMPVSPLDLLNMVRVRSFSNRA
jgi:hypothetical protein